MAFDGVNLLCELGCYRCGITGAGTNFEHAVLPTDLCGLDHERDNIRL
jgi:hypothetical protein